MKKLAKLIKLRMFKRNNAYSVVSNISKLYMRLYPSMVILFGAHYISCFFLATRMIKCRGACSLF
jgi:hypothetical protein